MERDWGSSRHLRWATCTTNATNLRPEVRKLVRHATATLVGDNIYLFGLFLVEPVAGYCNVFTIRHEHVPGAMIWTPLVRRGPEISEHSATLADDRIYLFGGLEKQGNHGTVQNLLRCFDTTLSAFVPCYSYGKTPCSRLGHSGDFIQSSNHIVVFGGETKKNGEATNCALAHFLQVSSTTWMTLRVKGNAPAPRSHHAHCVVNNSLFVSGGRNVHGHLFQDSHMLVCIDSNNYRWSSPRWTWLPSERVGASLSVIGSKLLLLGGKAGANSNVSNDLHVLDLRKRRWFKEARTSKRGDYVVAGKKVKTVYHAAVATSDKLVVFGGSCFPFEFCRMLEERKRS